MSSRIGLVVFDLGRVFIRICDDWQHACRRLGMEPPVVPTDETSQATFQQLAHQYDSGRIDLRTFAQGVARIGGFTAEQVIQVQQSYLLEPFDGVEPLLEQLHAKGLQTACLSNTTDNHWTMVHDPGSPHFLPMHRLTYKFASHLVGLAKPDAAIYEHVERETEFSPHKIVFFDDLPANVDAAQARGWNAHRIEIGPDPIFQIRRHLRDYSIALDS